MTRLRRTPRGGFSILEFVMVVLIISIILSLMLPAILSPREAARRTRCTNNLKQLALALHNYETLLGVLPPGVVNPTGPVSNRPDGLHIGWVVQLLPYMEQGGLAGAIDTRLSVYDPVNAATAATNISALTCPATMSAPTPAGAGVSSYAACHHDVEAPIDADNHGVFFLNSALRHADIYDGSAYTIFVGEKVPDAGDLGWLSGTRATLRNTGTPLKALAPTAATPPAAPAPSETYVGGFESTHPGGVNFAFGDGSVRFLSVTISPQVLRLLGHRDDGEPLGGDEF